MKYVLMFVNNVEDFEQWERMPTAEQRKSMTGFSDGSTSTAGPARSCGGRGRAAGAPHRHDRSV